jgi:L-lactate dehydrogenase complex protein LldE
MGTLKMDHILAAGPDILTSGDMSCLMHLTGLARAQGRPIRHCHAIEILRDTMPITV